ncbi:uncharacterized protein LOC129810163 isoform X2 [Phlebotomus papatasi]|uniref:uncharacterized protein LOC129810163 isoform X2 n=1 Tax=Phlebotomus papatasi TaxID=29031 RepID=UPI002483A535|nr:uncharacterized protein LOC129810163 isoform X2 [Phlebotomus papatasi]
MSMPGSDNIKEYYSRHGKFDKCWRDELVDRILDYFDAHNIQITCKMMAQISEEISEMFPTKEKVKYFSPKNAAHKYYGGLLFSRNHNRQRPLKREIRKETHSEVVEMVADPEINLSNLKEQLMTMTPETEISNESLTLWIKCFPLRKEDLLKSDSNDIIEQWPLFAHKEGNLLDVQ